MSTTPDDRRYAESHEWHKPEGELITIGLSQFAVDELTDITYLEITTTEGEVRRGESIGEVESVKATSEIYCGIDGEVVEVNQAAIEDPTLLNQDPYGKGWLVKVRPADPAQLDDLLPADEYERGASA